MNDPLQALLKLGALPTTLFPPTSRYHGVATVRLERDGRTLVYLRRRFVPQPGALALIQEHVVSEGERLDHLAARYLDDPELFWRLCDANGVLRPDELVETIGRRLRIAHTEGVPGTAHD